MAAPTNSRILRTIPLLIAVCLVGIPAQAKYGGGSGTADDPYKIATAADLIQPDDHGKAVALFELFCEEVLDNRLFMGYSLLCCPTERCRNGRQSFILPGI